MNSVEQEAIRLRQEHEDISFKRDKKGTVAHNRLTNPSKVRRTAGLIAGYLAPAQHAMSASITVMVGPKVTHEILQLDKAHRANLNAAKAHYEANANDYHQMAITDTPDHVTPVEFSGDVATKIVASRVTQPPAPVVPKHQI